MKVFENEALYTPAIAKELESQGYLKEAARVYSHLLTRMPGHAGFREALADIETRLSSRPVKDEELSSLFTEWLELLSAYGRLGKLTRLDLKKGCHDYETNG